MNDLWLFLLHCIIAGANRESVIESDAIFTDNIGKMPYARAEQMNVKCLAQSCLAILGLELITDTITTQARRRIRYISETAREFRARR